MYHQGVPNIFIMISVPAIDSTAAAAGVIGVVLVFCVPDRWLRRGIGSCSYRSRRDNALAARKPGDLSRSPAQRV